MLEDGQPGHSQEDGLLQVELIWLSSRHNGTGSGMVDRLVG